MSVLPLLDGYEDAIADLAVDCLGEVTFAGCVLDQEYLAGADLAGFSVARGNLDAGVEITASDGETRKIGAGEVFLVEDTSGKGHLSKAIDGKIRNCIFVPID